MTLPTFTVPTTRLVKPAAVLKFTIARSPWLMPTHRPHVFVLLPPLMLFELLGPKASVPLRAMIVPIVFVRPLSVVTPEPIFTRVPVAPMRLPATFRL